MRWEVAAGAFGMALITAGVGAYLAGDCARPLLAGEVDATIERWACIWAGAAAAGAGVVVGFILFRGAAREAAKV